jgi:hypothetical protein
MDLTSITGAVLRNISNIPGWITNRKIVVIESDDWGSIRMSSQDAFQNLLKANIPVNQSHYNLYDALESNADMEMIFETLSKFKDKSGRPPVMTGVNVVANPDFEAIKANGFTEYVYEPYTETLKRYPEHDNVYALWEEGIEKRLFVPVFHSREHLNVQRWMRSLQNGTRSTFLAFENRVTGISQGIGGEQLPDFQAAFDLDTPADLPYMQEVLRSGLDLFEKLYGYRSTYFIPTNGPFNNSLESVLLEKGVKYINTGKIQIEPLGNGDYKRHLRFLGQKNQYGQRYLTRNCFFEPSSMEHPVNTDWVGNCLKEMDIAFRWHKPVTISTHRVNYIGFLHPENREHSLKKLEELLSRALQQWPDIEFMTSVELGDLIMQKVK